VVRLADYDRRAASSNRPSFGCAGVSRNRLTQIGARATGVSGVFDPQSREVAEVIVCLHFAFPGDARDRWLRSINGWTTWQRSARFRVGHFASFHRPLAGPKGRKSPIYCRTSSHGGTGREPQPPPRRAERDLIVHASLFN
jgi:hypothetical protein